jgi:hypothetical protein
MVLFLGLMGTPFTIQLVAEHPLEGVLNDVMSLVFLQKGLYLFHQLIEKLISIALYHRVDRQSFVSDEGFAEFT